MPGNRNYGDIRKREKLEVLAADTIRASLAGLYPGLADSSEFKTYATDERIRNMNLPKCYHTPYITTARGGKMRLADIILPRCEERRKRIICDCVIAVEAELGRIYDRKIELLEPAEHEIDLTGNINNFRELVDYLDGEICEADEREGLVTKES